ncbi:MAG: hypothetical protein AAF458_07650 [Pseudomonadota bacterium]
MIGTALRWCDTYSRVLLAGGVFLGIAVPSAAEWLAPYAIPAVLACLLGALLLVDWEGLRVELKQPARIAALACIQLLVSPLVAWGLCVAVDLPETLTLIVMLQAAAPPISSAAVFIMLMGLDGALALVAALVSIALVPITLTGLLALIPDTLPSLDLGAFFARACLLVLVPFGLAALLRRLLGVARINRISREISGLNVLLLIAFAVGVMEGVTAEFLDRPGSAFGLLALAWIMAGALHLGGYVAFCRAGQHTAVSAAVLSGNRNLGLMFAVTAGLVPREFSLYVGIAQIPMYFVPLLLAPLLSRSRPDRA